MVMLEVVHVTKRYRRVLANDDINLTIEDGRIGVLLGPNGAGKSTIIKCIMGFLKISGTDTGKRSRKQVHRGEKDHGIYSGNSIVVSEPDCG